MLASSSPLEFIIAKNIPEFLSHFKILETSTPAFFVEFIKRSANPSFPTTLKRVEFIPNLAKFSAMFLATPPGENSTIPGFFVFENVPGMLSAKTNIEILISINIY